MSPIFILMKIENDNYSQMQNWFIYNFNSCPIWFNRFFFTRAFNLDDDAHCFSKQKIRKCQKRILPFHVRMFNNAIDHISGGEGENKIEVTVWRNTSAKNSALFVLFFTFFYKKKKHQIEYKTIWWTFRQNGQPQPARMVVITTDLCMFGIYFDWIK